MKIKDFIKLDLNKINLIDIREKEEFEELPKIKQALHIPKDKLVEELKTLQISKDKEIYIICRIGNRSQFMTMVLKNMGYNVIDVEGGILEYNKQLGK